MTSDRCRMITLLKHPDVHWKSDFDVREGFRALCRLAVGREQATRLEVIRYTDLMGPLAVPDSSHSSSCDCQPLEKA